MTLVILQKLAVIFIFIGTIAGAYYFYKEEKQWQYAVLGGIFGFSVTAITVYFVVMTTIAIEFLFS